MGRKKNYNFYKRVEEIREMLAKYGGIPSPKEDRVSYAAIKYYVLNYSEHPYIKELIEKYSLQDIGIKKSKEYTLREIEDTLKKYGSVQDLRGEKKLYYRIYNYISAHLDDEKCKYLAYKYSLSKTIQIPNSKYPKLPCYYFLIDPKLYSLKLSVTYENILWGFNKYGELPSEKSLQIQFLLDTERLIKRRGKECSKYFDVLEFYSFIENVIARGAKSEILESILYRRFTDGCTCL